MENPFKRFMKVKDDLEEEKFRQLELDKLKKLDKVAYIRFASVYRDFKDVEDFKNAVREIK